MSVSDSIDRKHLNYLPIYILFLEFGWIFTQSKRYMWNDACTTHGSPISCVQCSSIIANSSVVMKVSVKCISFQFVVLNFFILWCVNLHLSLFDRLYIITVQRCCNHCVYDFMFSLLTFSLDIHQIFESDQGVHWFWIDVHLNVSEKNLTCIHTLYTGSWRP